MTRLLTAAATPVVAIATALPAAAQTSPDSPEPIRVVSPGLDSGGPDMGGFVALFVVFGLISVGISIWKFTSIRDMGIRRGMSRSDATTAAFFSDDRVTSTMILKPEVDNRRRRGLRRRPPRPADPEPTIEERLAKVDALHERNVITAAEAASRRDEILDEI